MELAVAALVLVGLELVVSAAAAHQLAAIHALRGLVAETAVRSQRACALIAQTVIWARIDVHQILGGGNVEALVHLLQLAAPVDAHGRSAVVLLLQELTYTPEVCQL